VNASLAIGFLSLIVWAHHMFITGMGTTMSSFFQTTTILISIPSVVILTCLFLSLWGGAIRFTTPMLFALAFLPMFGIGGLTGLPLGLAPTGLHLHDTYYVVAHFHYIVAPGTIFALFAGIYHWFPKVTGRRMNDRLGQVHFAGTLVCMNLIFLPMLFQGLAGMNRRLYDGGLQYALDRNVVGLHLLISRAAWTMAIFQLIFIANFFWSVRFGRRAPENPWEATTLEWAAPSPPVHGNFVSPPAAYRGPYEYSAPGARADFTPQFVPEDV
jgi:cytochrome c oxidase subunit 1